MFYKVDNGNITNPKGFKASGVSCGLKGEDKKDLALIVSDCIADVAAVFTTNVVKGHSLQVSMNNINNGKAKAIVINSGNANACNGEQGYEDALEMTRVVASELECVSGDVLVGSTGVIGFLLPMDKIIPGIKSAAKKLSYDGGHDAELAIMTTDKIAKEACVQFKVNDKTVTIGGIAKGSGMIHPNMATMIGVITTDANISAPLLDNALKKCVNKSFNRVTVDGDTSVCDKVIIMANGKAGNAEILDDTEEYKLFTEALEYVCKSLSKKIAKDGEGATKLIDVIVNNAVSPKCAKDIAFSVAKSPLVKTAIFGEDANWGRIITAAGYSGAQFDPQLVDIYIGDVKCCENGTALLFDEDKAKKQLMNDEVSIVIDLKSGDFSDHVWTCDFSYEYVEINGSYRS